MRITACKVNHLSNPLGYCLPHTVFTWRVEDAKGSRAVASRLCVCQDAETICDTGWTELDSRCTKLDLPLKPRTRYTWQVHVKSDIGEEADSNINWFETGLMDEPWSAKWIGCDDFLPQGSTSAAWACMKRASTGKRSARSILRPTATTTTPGCSTRPLT